MMEPRPPLRKRVTRAITVLVAGIFMWVLIPDYIGVLVSGKIQSSAILNPEFVFVVGAVIIGLQVAEALTEGARPSIPIQSAVSLLIAYYLWAATNGGSLSFSSNGTQVGLWFEPLVLLVMLPSLWTAVRTPLSFLVMRKTTATRQTSSKLPTQLPSQLRSPGGV